MDAEQSSHTSRIAADPAFSQYPEEYAVFSRVFLASANDPQRCFNSLSRFSDLCWEAMTEANINLREAGLSTDRYGSYSADMNHSSQLKSALEYLRTCPESQRTFAVKAMAQLIDPALFTALRSIVEARGIDDFDAWCEI